jgi:ABC-type nitrate/sulfonate/bicarbonate transport system substrate-binding protein
MKAADVFVKTLAAAALLAAGGAQAQDVVRLGNLKFAHYGAVSYIKEIAPKCGIKVEEKVFAKGLDVMQAIIAGELDVGTTASEAAISGRAGGAPIYVVAGFAKGGARLVARSRQQHQVGQGLERQEGRRDARRHPGSAADGRAAEGRPVAGAGAGQGRAADLTWPTPT